MNSEALITSRGRVNSCCWTKQKTWVICKQVEPCPGARHVCRAAGPGGSGFHLGFSGMARFMTTFPSWKRSPQALHEPAPAWPGLQLKNRKSKTSICQGGFSMPMWNKIRMSVSGMWNSALSVFARYPWRVVPFQRVEGCGSIGTQATGLILIGDFGIQILCNMKYSELSYLWVLGSEAILSWVAVWGYSSHRTACESESVSYQGCVFTLVGRTANQVTSLSHCEAFFRV